MARRKTGDEDNLTDANLEKVIKLLEPAEGKAITKKDACQILGIAYNVTRLGTLIEKFKEKKQRDHDRRVALRGKPITDDEVAYIASEYLEGATIDSISTATYRSTDMVKKVLEANNVPIRTVSHSYFDPVLLPEGSIKDRFTVGEIVYSSRYDSKARVTKEAKDSRNLGYIYQVWLMSEKQLQYAWTEAFELASLAHLVEKGIKL